MKTSESIEKIAAALVKFQGEVESPKRMAENPAFKREGKNLKYADLDAIIKTITPVLSSHGLSQHQFTDTDMESKSVKITTMLLHETGQYIISDTLILPAENRGKFDAQSIGSAITYGRRYSLSALLGIASENDDDANSISGNDKHQPEPKTINQAQQKGLFDLAGENIKAVKDVLLKYRIANSKDIMISDYELICKEVAEAVKVSTEAQTA